MKLLLLLGIASLFAADPAGFVVWKAADLKNYEKTLHPKINQDHTANERLPDCEGHMVVVVHREGTGAPEAHETLSHIIYVISGEADLVVGGAMVDAKTVAPEQIRGTSVSGGETKRVAAGDVLHIPPKAPHYQAGTVPNAGHNHYFQSPCATDDAPSCRTLTRLMIAPPTR